VNTAEELTYEKLEESNHDLCVNTVDRRQQRRQVSLKLRQRSLGRLNEDQGELQPTERRLHHEQENSGDHCRKASISHLQCSNKGADARYERDAETGVVRSLKPGKDRHVARPQNFSGVRGSQQVDRFEEDKESRWVHSTKHHSIDAQVIQQQSVDVVNCGRSLQHCRRGKSIALLNEASNVHATNVDGSMGSRQHAVTSRQSMASFYHCECLIECLLLF